MVNYAYYTWNYIDDQSAIRFKGHFNRVTLLVHFFFFWWRQKKIQQNTFVVLLYYSRAIGCRRVPDRTPWPLSSVCVFTSDNLVSLFVIRALHIALISAPWPASSRFALSLSYCSVSCTGKEDFLSRIFLGSHHLGNSWAECIPPWFVAVFINTKTLLLSPPPRSWFLLDDILSSSKNQFVIYVMCSWNWLVCWIVFLSIVPKCYITCCAKD